MTRGGENGNSRDRSARKSARDDRLAAALRANLRRRKAQVRGRAAPEPAKSAPKPEQDR